MDENRLQQAPAEGNVRRATAPVEPKERLEGRDEDRSHADDKSNDVENNQGEDDSYDDVVSFEKARKIKQDFRALLDMSDDVRVISVRFVNACARM
jgi:hypothetical protein